MYEVGVVEHFEAAHALKGDFGPATRHHGHRYRVQLSVRGKTLHEDGSLFDIGRLTEALRTAIGGLHERDLNAIEAFQARNSTAEVVAEHLLDQVQQRIDPAGLDSIAISVWESPDAYAALERRLAATD